MYLPCLYRLEQYEIRKSVLRCRAGREDVALNGGGVEEKAKKVRWACFEASRLQNQAEKYTSGTAPKDGFG